jgi:hypothetical protein
MRDKRTIPGFGFDPATGATFGTVPGEGYDRLISVVPW